MIVLVCGGRTYDDRERLNRELTDLHTLHGIDRLIHGAAKGTDSMADYWAAVYCVPRSPYPIRRPRENGFQRNARMLVSEPRIDLGVAFPGGAGTADMVRRLKRAGIPVKEIT